MSTTTKVSQVRALKNDALGVSLARLAKALMLDFPGQECHWAKVVHGALEAVETALKEHIASTKDPGGLLAEIDLTRPTLARRAEGLCREHHEFMKRLRHLRNDNEDVQQAFQPVVDAATATKARGLANAGAVRDEAVQLLADLQHNQNAEMDLILDSLNTEIGAGD
jgi:hypothetical protein